MENKNQTCTKKGCKEEGKFWCGTLKNPQILCLKHFEQRFKKKEKRRLKTQ